MFLGKYSVKRILNKNIYIYNHAFSGCFYPRRFTREEQKQFIKEATIFVIYNGKFI